MRLRTWAGSIIELECYPMRERPRMCWRWALGWLRFAVWTFRGRR